MTDVQDPSVLIEGEITLYSESHYGLNDAVEKTKNLLIALTGQRNAISDKRFVQNTCKGELYGATLAWSALVDKVY